MRLRSNSADLTPKEIARPRRSSMPRSVSNATASRPIPPIRADVAYNTLVGISSSLSKEYKEYQKEQKYNREYGMRNADCGTVARAKPDSTKPGSYAIRIPNSKFQSSLRYEDRWAKDSGAYSGRP